LGLSVGIEEEACISSREEEVGVGLKVPFIFLLVIGGLRRIASSDDSDESVSVSVSDDRRLRLEWVGLDLDEDAVGREDLRFVPVDLSPFIFNLVLGLVLMPVLFSLGIVLFGLTDITDVKCRPNVDQSESFETRRNKGKSVIERKEIKTQLTHTTHYSQNQARHTTSADIHGLFCPFGHTDTGY
jgi:hypothetical protein